MSVQPPKTRSEERLDSLKETIEAATQRLAEQLAQGHTQHYLELLRFWGSFHRYSYGNVLLIMSQRPDATHVAGYRTWKKLGRQVRQGAKAVWIFCPIIKEEIDPETGLKVERCLGFRDCPVFAAEDLVDIETNPLPTLWQRLPDDQEELFSQLKARVEAAGFPVRFARLRRGVQGTSNIQTGAITLAGGMDSRSRIATLIHELLHSLAHRDEAGKQLSREQKEFESESVSHVVCAALGFDYPAASDYILSFGGTADQLKASLPRIHALTRQVMAIVLPKERKQQEETEPIAAD